MTTTKPRRARNRNAPLPRVIRETRAALGLTQADVNRLSGGRLSPSDQSRIENGSVVAPQLPTLEIYSEVFNVSIGWLYHAANYPDVALFPQPVAGSLSRVPKEGEAALDAFARYLGGTDDPIDWHALTPAQRRTLDEFARVVVAHRARGARDDSEITL